MLNKVNYYILKSRKHRSRKVENKKVGLKDVQRFHFFVRVILGFFE